MNRARSILLIVAVIVSARPAQAQFDQEYGYDQQNGTCMLHRFLLMETPPPHGTGPRRRKPKYSPRGHCQVDEKRASRSVETRVSIIVQQVHVTASQAENDRILSNR